MSVSVYAHQNYREYLKVFYESKKREGSGFTYAHFAQRAGLRSPNYLKLVIDGTKNLTPNNVLTFANGLGLCEQEREYFEALVNFNQARTALEKEYHQSRMSRIKVRAENGPNQRTLEEYEFEMVSHWAYHALLVLTNVRYFKEDPKWISAKLFGQVSPDEVKTMLEKLIAMGLLVRNAEGRLTQSRREINTKPELRRVAIQTFYEGLLDRAKLAIKVSEPEEREFGTFVVGVSKTQLGDIKLRVREFLRSLNEFALENQKPDEVYALSFFGFPLSAEERR